MLPGAQARIGRFLRTNPVQRAFFKSIGSHLFGEEIKDLTGSEEKGEYAKAGALFGLSLFDRQGIGRFVSATYNRARDALRNLGNPPQNATRYINNLFYAQ